MAGTILQSRTMSANTGLTNMRVEQNDPLNEFVDGLSEHEREAYKRNEPLFNTIYFTVPRIVRFVFLMITLGLWIYMRMTPDSIDAERILIMVVAAGLVEPWVSESFNKRRGAVILGVTFLIVQLVLML